MSKVRTFSRSFPKGHPKEGQSTFFVEKIYKSLLVIKPLPKKLVIDLNFAVIYDEAIHPKHHTIRAGKHFKAGDCFSPRVWSGKPYNSKQITIAEDIKIEKVFDIRIWRESKLNWRVYINGQIISAPQITKLAKNDGLSHRDFLDWFDVPVEKTFEGQILCWFKDVEY